MNFHRAFFVFISLCALLNLSSCTQDEPLHEPSPWLNLQGNAQGTTFSIQYEDTLYRDFSDSIYAILKKVDKEVSNYDSTSLLYKFNYNTIDTVFLNEQNAIFTSIFLESIAIKEKTQHSFNPFIYNLVQYWGFGTNRKKPENVSKIKIDSLLSLSHKIKTHYNIMEEFGYGDFPPSSWLEPTYIVKENKQAMLDFNAIAQGFSVDLIAELFNQNKINNYLVEIGGEVRVKGHNKKKSKWNIGIDKPSSNNETRSLSAIVELDSGALATSGSYRKFFTLNGKKYSHAINPLTGYPVDHSTLSVSVYANKCSTADAYATAFLVMGKDRIIDFLNQNQNLNLDVYVIYEENHQLRIFQSEGFPKISDP